MWLIGKSSHRYFSHRYFCGLRDAVTPSEDDEFRSDVATEDQVSLITDETAVTANRSFYVKSDAADLSRLYCIVTDLYHERSQTIPCEFTGQTPSLDN